MSVTVYDPFASIIGIDKIGNQSDYPSVYIVPWPFFLYFESLLCNGTFSILSYTDGIHIVTSADWDHQKWSSAHDIA